MGILMGALAGAGKAAGEIADANIKLWGKQELAQQQAQLSQAKEEAMARLNSGLTEQRTIAAEARAQEPLKRFGNMLSANQNAEVPMTAAPVTTSDGVTGAATVNGQTAGLKGDVAELRKRIEQFPPEDRDRALAQLDAQVAAQNDKAQQGILGKSRKLTSDEALSKTREEALASDPVALAAYEKTLGETSRKDRRLDLAELKNDTQQEFNNRRMDRLDRLAEIRADAEAARANRLEGKQDTAMEKAELNSRRTATIELMKSTEHEIERTMTLAGSAMDPETAKAYKARADRLSKDLTTYRSALESFTGGAVNRDEPKAPTNTWNDATGEVIANGKVIGTAKSAAEAKALIAKGPAAPAKEKPPAPAPAAKPAAVDTGIEGLSIFALKRIAQDPKNPLYEVAKAALEKKQGDTKAMQYDRVNDPQFDPSLYTN